MFYQISKILIFKIFLSITFISLLLSVGSPKAYALTCEGFGDNPPGLEQIVCPIARVVNVMLLSAGAVLIIMILWGGFKLATALGDPKGFQAATSTWVHAVVGFLIVVGAIAFLGIITKMLGWEFDFASPFEVIQTAIKDFATKLGIVYEGTTGGSNGSSLPPTLPGQPIPY